MESRAIGIPDGGTANQAGTFQGPQTAHDALRPIKKPMAAFVAHKKVLAPNQMEHSGKSSTEYGRDCRKAKRVGTNTLYST